MADAKDHIRYQKKYISSINGQKKYRQHRQRGSGYRDTENAAIEILHSLLTPEVTDPEYLVKDHNEK